MKSRRRLQPFRSSLALTCERLEDRRPLAADLTREFVPNEILVQYVANASPAQISKARGSASAKLAETIHTKTMVEAGQGKLERLTLSKKVGLQKAIQALQRNPLVRFAEPNYILRSTAVSNDTSYNSGSLWGLYGDDAPSAVGPTGTTNPFGSHAEKAWNENFTGSSNVVIGIIDEGIQTTHPDLKNNIWVNPYEIPGDGIDNDGNGYIDDIHGWDFVYNNNSVYDVGEDAHGTHVAGTIGGEGNNGAGVAGMNWDVSMISMKFLGPNGGTLSNAVKAIDYLTDMKARHGVNIVASNNSWGGGGYSQTLHDAIIRSAKKDILFIAAAGNSTSNNDSTVSYPSNYNTMIGTSTQTAASYDSVIAVASITNTGAISSFSSYGSTTVDIGAPGSSILSTVPSNTYATYSGTSMATPHVTGAVALYASAQPTGVSAASIKAAILESATPTTSLVGKTATGGRLNVYEAIKRSASTAGVTVSPPSATTTTEAGSQVTFTVRLNSQPAGDVTIPISSSDLTEGTLSPASLVFTASNWNILQTVTVTGANDFVDDGNVLYTIALGLVTSSDTAYQNLNPADVTLSNVDDDTAGITVINPSEFSTTEAGGAGSFTVRLNSQPTSNVTIPISSSDITEGTAGVSSLVFTPENWANAQAVTVTGVDDSVYDGNASYRVVIGAAVSTDLLYHGKDAADVSLVNIDDDPAPPTKFYVVNDGTPDRTFEYDPQGSAIENYTINTGNSAPRGIATTVVGDKTWVVDANRKVFIYDTSGGLLGTWTAGSLHSRANVQGIATNGTDIWIVDAYADRVYFYENAANHTSGTFAATQSFALRKGNNNPKDIVTDGTSLWVVNDARTDTVYKYTVAGAFVSAWNLNTANKSPTGITIDPSDASQDIWVVDSGTDRVYRYADARTLASPTLTSSFPLAAGNTNPQGIADPPPASLFVESEASSVTETTLEFESPGFYVAAFVSNVVPPVGSQGVSAFGSSSPSSRPLAFLSQQARLDFLSSSEHSSDSTSLDNETTPEPTSHSSFVAFNPASNRTHHSPSSHSLVNLLASKSRSDIEATDAVFAAFGSI